MPLIVSECGENEANGYYYMEQKNPPKYVHTNRNHQILEQIQTINQGYGGCYQQKVWILQKTNTCNGSPCVLYISYSNNNGHNNIEWKPIAGSRPTPKINDGMVQNNKNNKNMNENKNNLIFNGNQGTKRRNHGDSVGNLSRKRTFTMFNNRCNDDMNDMNDMNYKQPPNKRMRFNDHGNQCNDNNYFHFGFNHNNNNNNDKNQYKKGNQKENLFRINRF